MTSSSGDWDPKNPPFPTATPLSPLTLKIMGAFGKVMLFWFFWKITESMLLSLLRGSWSGTYVMQTLIGIAIFFGMILFSWFYVRINLIGTPAPQKPRHPDF